MSDFAFTTHGVGFYALQPRTARAVRHFRSADPVYVDDTRAAVYSADDLLSQGFTVTLDGRELCLATN